MSSEYSFEKFKTSARFKKIISLLDIDDKRGIESLFRDVWYVRDAFAHTFIDIEKIEYRKTPLNACFGTTYNGSVHNEADFTFVDSVDRLINSFITLFTKRQIEQIDAEKFASICNRFLAARTLGR